MSLDDLGARMLAAGARAETLVHAAVSTTADAITNDARQRIEDGHPHLPLYPESITFDVTVTPGSVTAEIGPDAEKPQGKLGPLLERGGATSRPMPHLGPATDDHIEAFAAKVLAAGGAAF